MNVHARQLARAEFSVCAVRKSLSNINPEESTIVTAICELPSRAEQRKREKGTWIREMQGKVSRHYVSETIFSAVSRHKAVAHYPRQALCMRTFYEECTVRRDDACKTASQVVELKSHAPLHRDAGFARPASNGHSSNEACELASWR